MADQEKSKTVSVGDILSKDSKAAPKKAAAKPKTEKKKHKHTHIEHHDDGSHTVRHTPVGGGDEVSYAAPDMDAVHDGLEQHVGEANAGEQPEGGAAPQAEPPMAGPQSPMPGQGA